MTKLSELLDKEFWRQVKKTRPREDDVKDKKKKPMEKPMRNFMKYYSNIWKHVTKYSQNFYPSFPILSMV